jgi:pimeloyl-ACP methyl ester carboxylesterase
MCVELLPHVSRSQDLEVAMRNDETLKRVNCLPFTISVEDRELSARRFAGADQAWREARRPGLVFIHGLGSSQSSYMDRAEAAARSLGAVCVIFDLGGHGESEGKLRDFTPRDHLADVIAAFDALAEDQVVDGSRIGVCAASYGAYLATLLTSLRPVARLLLRAPGLYDDKDLDTSLDRPRKSNPFAEAHEVTRRLQKYSGTLLILEGEFDEVIPHEIIEVYLRACRDAKHAVIPNAHHALDDELTRKFFRDAIVRFFKSL